MAHTYSFCRSLGVWKKTCQPVLNAAGLRVEIVETQRPKHALEVASNAAVKDFDALACVGGDGTMSEILQVLYPAKLTLRIILSWRKRPKHDIQQVLCT